jgi:hypothetical protein
MMIASRRVRFLVAVAAAASSFMMMMMIRVGRRETYSRGNDQRRPCVWLFGKHQLYDRWNGAGLQGWFGIRETRLSVRVSILMFMFMFMLMFMLMFKFMFLSMFLLGGVKGRTWGSRLGHIVGSGCLGFCSDVVVLWGCIYWFGSCSFLIHRTL